MSHVKFSDLRGVEDGSRRGGKRGFNGFAMTTVEDGGGGDEGAAGGGTGK